MKKVITIITVLALVLSLVACGGKKASSEDKGIIGYAVNSVDAFWAPNVAAVTETVEAAGYELMLLNSTKDSSLQNDQIKQMITAGAKAIILVAQDGAAVASAVKEAQDAGVYVVMDNRPLQSDEVVADMSILSANRVIAYKSGVWLGEEAKANNEQYKICLFLGALSDENMIERAEGIRQAVEEYSDYLEIVVEVPTDGVVDNYFSGAQNALQAYDDINCIITPYDAILPTIQSALEPLGRWVPYGEEDHITIIGFDGDANACWGIDTGYSDATGVQDPYGQGKAAAEWAIKLIEGETPAENIQMDEGFVASRTDWDNVKEDVWGYSIYLESDLYEGDK